MTFLLAVGLLASACGSNPSTTEATATPSATASTASSTPTATASPSPTGTDSPTASATPTATSTSTPGSTSSPTEASDPLTRTSLTLDASGHLFTETPVAAVPRASRSGGTCAVAAPPTEATIVDCASANAEGGGIAVTVEEADDRFHATLWKSIDGGSQWEAVAQTPIWTRGDGGSGSAPEPNQIVPEGTDHMLAMNVIDVGFEIGGSGGFWDHQVVDWARGESDPGVAYTIARPSPTVMWQAGRMVVDAPHLADGDANCCPSEREVVVVERPTGRSSVPAVSTIVPRGEDTPELLATEVYRAWLDGSVASIPNSRLASAARSYLNSNPSGGQDVYGFSSSSCSWDGTRYACELTSTGNTMTWRIEPTPAGTHQLVDIVEGSP